MTRRADPRLVSIWLPRLSVERWQKLDGASHPADAPIVLTREGSHGLLIHAVTRAAAQAGARAGQRLTDARAVVPSLIAIPADLAGDRGLVERLGRWAGRWSPLVEVDGADGLRFDATGAAHLFGGEARMLLEIETKFAGLGLTARAAMAPTPGAAWALARYGPDGVGERSYSTHSSPPHPRLLGPTGRRRAVQGEIARALAPLPIEALRIGPEVVRTLQRLGLKTIGTLAGIERRSLARRFRDKDNPLDALDKALGKASEPLTPTRGDRPPRALARFKEPVTDPAAGPQALRRLVPELARELEDRRLGARRLALIAYRVDGSIHRIEAATAFPTREIPHLNRLLGEKAEALDPGFGVDAVALVAPWTERLDAAQDALDGKVPQAVEVGRLVDRITAKLGDDVVTRPHRAASHLPERSAGWRPALADGASEEKAPVQAPRPQRLLDRPEAIGVLYATPEGVPRRFVWRRAVHDIRKVEGPERIAPEWWREFRPARLRDYYRVEDQAGRRYWIFREGLHGDGRGGDPAWYIHGLFA
ncbi:DUF6504 family protein [Sphingomicrobium marinum]|uniref:DUF6504 family protein n=1 Tax=Sphingomicrobium marinum TaxID=1227950 RepID=UPI00223FB633|nr:DUF6504 family protein [Sphingomicrobium marinum]